MYKIESLDEIEELISWNLSYGINMIDTLKQIKREDLEDYFNLILEKN